MLERFSPQLVIMNLGLIVDYIVICCVSDVPQTWCDSSGSQTGELFICRQEGNITFESY
jgi:hypothetical protein